MCACVPVPRVLLHLLVWGSVQGCVVGPWILPRPATPGWGVGLCVCFCACPACTPPFLDRCAVWACVLGSGFSCAPPILVWLLGCVCGRARAPLAPALPGEPPVAGGCAAVAVGGVCPPPVPFGFFFGGGALWCESLVVPVLGLVLSVPPSLLFRAALFFFFTCPTVVCVRVFWVSLLLSVGHCSRLGVARYGWVVSWCLFRGSCLRCCLGDGFGRLLWCWRAVKLGWGVCLFLPLPSLSGRMHWSSFCVAFRSAVGGCVLPGRAPAPSVELVMYTLGSAPSPARLGSGSAGSAVAPGGFVRQLVSRVLFVPAVPVLTFWRRLVWVDRDCCCRACCGPLPVCGGLLRLLQGCAVAWFG